MNANTHTARALLGALALAAVAITGCSSSSKSAATTSPAAAASTVAAAATSAPADTGAPADTVATSTPAAGGAALTIKGFAFSALTAPAGQAITVTNEDTAAHTVTADDGSFSVDVPAGGTATLTVATAGTYAIHCKIHSSMKGSITIG